MRTAPVPTMRGSGHAWMAGRPTHGDPYIVYRLVVPCYSLPIDDERFALTYALGVMPKYRVKAREKVNKSE